MSIGIKKFNESLSFAEQPVESQLKDWAQAGFRSVVNLRPPDEVERGLSPAAEESLCQAMGLSYRHVPTSLDDLSEEHFRACREKLEGLPEPIVLHCHGGARAAIVAAAVYALKVGASGDEVIAMVEGTGQSLNPQLRDRVVDLIDSL